MTMTAPVPRPDWQATKESKSIKASSATLNKGGQITISIANQKSECCQSVHSMVQGSRFKVSWRYLFINILNTFKRERSEGGLEWEGGHSPLGNQWNGWATRDNSLHIVPATYKATKQFCINITYNILSWYMVSYMVSRIAYHIWYHEVWSHREEGPGSHCLD